MFLFPVHGFLLLATQALRHLRNVQVVNFGDCLVRCEGAIALAAVLREGLPVLKVSWPSDFRLFTCVFSVYSLVTVLCRVSCFQELNLSFGEITEAAALVVAQAVMDKPDMERVDLNGMHTVELVLLSLQE